MPDEALTPKPSAQGAVVWMTGLPCAGKSSIARGLGAVLGNRRVAHEILDGDELRQYLSPDLGYTRDDRDQNVARIGFVAGVLARHGIVSVVAVVSPYHAARDKVRNSVPNFVEVFINCPVSECERRDVKGMYARARARQLLNFTGVDDPYEVPRAAELELRTNRETIEVSCARLVAHLEERGIITRDVKTR